jgi:hypothetical protein
MSHRNAEGRQITRTGSVRLLADLLMGAEHEVYKLRVLLVKHHCTCRTWPKDPLDVENHPATCGYRQIMEET